MMTSHHNIIMMWWHHRQAVEQIVGNNSHYGNVTDHEIVQKQNKTFIQSWGQKTVSSILTSSTAYLFTNLIINLEQASLGKSDLPLI